MRQKIGGSTTISTSGVSRALAMVLLVALFAVVSPHAAGAQDADEADEFEPAPVEDSWEGHPAGLPMNNYVVPALPNNEIDCAVDYGLPDVFLPPATAVGTHRMSVMFVDFVDARATETTEETFARIWSETPGYIDEVSDGRINLEVVAEEEWLEMPRPAADYDLRSSDGGPRLFDEVFDLAGPAWDPESFDSVMVVTELSVRAGGAYVVWHDFDSDGTSVPTILGSFGSFTSPSTAELDFLEMVAAHEFFHTLGLMDLYNVWIPRRPLRLSFLGNFSPMSDVAGHEGGTTTGTTSTRNGNELLAVEAWSLGWIDDAQVVCAVEEAITTTASLTGPTRSGEKTIMAPITSTLTLFAEVHEQQRWDADIEAEGVLVFTLEERIPSGSGPVRALGEFDGEWADGSILLQEGESLEFQGWTVSVDSVVGDVYEVSMTFSGTCDGKTVTINLNQPGAPSEGTPADDVILGTDGDDVIRSFGGNDTICAGEGRDVVVAGDGDDVVFGGLGIDYVYAQAGNDTVHGEGGSDRIWAGGGDDTVLAGSGADRVWGEEGVDDLFGMGGKDTMWGGDGDDQMQGNFQSDRLYGGPGDDVIRGAGGKDRLYGDAGSDQLFGGDNSDWLDGGDGGDFADGQRGREYPFQAGIKGCVAETTIAC